MPTMNQKQGMEIKMLRLHTIACAAAKQDTLDLVRRLFMGVSHDSIECVREGCIPCI
jgi:hypothetical protein